MSPEKSIESVRSFEQKALEVVAKRAQLAIETVAPEIDQVAAIANWFVQAVPAPSDKNKAVQLGCHFEEVGEMFDAIGEPAVGHNLSVIADHYKQSAAPLQYITHDDLLDSLCDQIVTAIGVAHMMGMDIQGALTEVNRSNWSKFVDGKPVFDANGKIAKPASYSKPDLSPFV